MNNPYIIGYGFKNNIWISYIPVYSQHCLFGKTNLYEKVDIFPLNPEIDYGWKAGVIYRLKD